MTDNAEQVRVVQYGRRWWSAYTDKGRYLAMGETRREATENADARLA